MVAVAALTVVPAGQVDTSGFTVTLHKAICALINICKEEQRHIHANNVLENKPSSLDLSSMKLQAFDTSSLHMGGPPHLRGLTNMQKHTVDVCGVLSIINQSILFVKR